MTRKFTMTILASMMTVALASCGKAPEADRPAADAAAPATAAAAPPAAEATAPPAPEEAVPAASQTCALLDDANALFGKEVKAEAKTMPNGTQGCEWKSADGRLCGSVMVLGPGYNEVPDLPANYTAMTRSLGAFGETKPLPGVGKEAVEVDGGMLGAQAAVLTDKGVVNVGAACGGNSKGNLEHVGKLARAVAAKL